MEYTLSVCFVPVMAINKPDFLAGYSLFYESARYGGDFMAAIENNRNFTLSQNKRQTHVDDQTGEMVRQGVQDEAEVFQYCAADLHE